MSSGSGDSEWNGVVLAVVASSVASDGSLGGSGVLTDDVTGSIGNEGICGHDGFLHNGSLGSLDLLDLDAGSGGNLLGTGFSAGLGEIVFLVTDLMGGLEGVSITLANDALDLGGNLLLER